jgi:putative intracellular protease/amidase
VVPKSFGILLYPAYTALDVYGPLESLTIYGYTHTIKLYIIAATMDPVSTRNRMFAAQNSTTNFAVLPTHTFDTVPPIDVLLIPGGLGERSPIEELQSAIDYVARVTPDLQYLLTVCTGAGIAARAGVLDGKFATTNSTSFSNTKTRCLRRKRVERSREIGSFWALLFSLETSITEYANLSDRASLGFDHHPRSKNEVGSESEMGYRWEGMDQLWCPGGYGSHECFRRTCMGKGLCCVFGFGYGV